MKKLQVVNILSHEVREILAKERLDYALLQEIRLRIGHPIILCYGGRSVYKRRL